MADYGLHGLRSQSSHHSLVRHRDALPLKQTVAEENNRQIRMVMEESGKQAAWNLVTTGLTLQNFRWESAKEPLDAFEIRGFVRQLTTTPTVDAWIGGDLFVSLQNLLDGRIGRSLLCEYFQIGPEKLEDWTAEDGAGTRRINRLNDFYRINDHVVRCARNDNEVIISERNLSKTTAGKDILLEEEGREDGGTCGEGCFGWH